MAPDFERISRAFEGHTPPDAAAAGLPAEAMPEKGSVRVAVTLLAALGVVFLAPMTLVFVVGQFRDQHLLMVVTVIASGATGGMLQAIAHGTFRLPDWRQGANIIYLGAVADCAFGVCGAFVVFIITPGLSEKTAGDISDTNAPEVMRMLDGVEDPALRTQLLQELVKEDSTRRGVLGFDVFVEVVGVSLVGGYAGRALILRAVRNVESRDRRDSGSASEPRTSAGGAAG